MEEKDEALSQLLTYYREQGAPENQQLLISLLCEAQEMDGGLLKQDTLEYIRTSFGLGQGFLKALIRRVPALRAEDVPHRLEMCGTCPKGRPLAAFLEKEYGVRGGDVCARGGFSFRVTGCMKNCKHGPSIRWDGQLYSHADEALLRRLIEGKAN